MAKIAILLSGGIDSAACAAFFLEQTPSVETFFIDYGQAAAGLELRSAAAIARHYALPLRHFRWSGGSIKGQGLIVGRNAFLCLAALMELSNDVGLLALGIHSGTNYRDCSPAFIEYLQSLVDLYTDGTVQLAAPFLNWTKQDIFAFCRDRSVPVQLSYSCERGTTPPCGSCLSCRDVEVFYART